MDLATPTDREATIIRTAATISARGKLSGEDIITLGNIGIDILDHLDGLVPDPTTAVSMGQVSDSTALHALSRWAHPDPTRHATLDPTINL
jgi:hypothetical protein